MTTLQNSLGSPTGKSCSPVAEIAARTLCALFYSYFCYVAMGAFLETRSLPILLLLTGETLTVLLIITARFPKAINRSLYASTITIAASFYFILVDLSDGIALVAVGVTVGFQLAGILLQIAAKLHLGRSFGLAPANRGIVTSGPYRLVRHPIYLGYFLNHIGFLLAMWSLHNLAIYALLYTLQFLRIRAEEKILCQDESYQDYRKSVRYRFIPFVA